MANRDYTIQGPDGRELTITGPDNATPDQLRAAAERAFASAPPKPRAQPLPSHQTQQPRRTIQQGVGDAAAGVVSGAANIGATLLSPFAMAEQAMESAAGMPPRQQSITQGRRAAIRSVLEDAGADPTSLPFRGAELGSEVAGTLGVGPALAARATAWGLPRLAQALATGGLALRPAGQAAPAMGWAARVGEQGIRAAGGGVSAAASAGLANPEDAAAGGALGAVLPGALRVAGAAGSGAANILMQPFQSLERRVGPALGAVLPDQDAATLGTMAAELRAGNRQLVPGSRPNAAEASGDPGLANLVRAVQAAGGRELFDLAESNALARTNVLASLGGAGDNVAQVRDDLGRELERRIIPEERRISDQVRALFQGVDPNNEARLFLPTEDISALAQELGVQATRSLPDALQQYVGRGTVGAGGGARSVLEEAQGLTTGAANNAIPGMTATELQPVNWQELQNLRSSVGALARSLRKDPATARDAAALEAMQSALDARVAAAARGELLPGEVFTPEMNARWQAARAAHAAKVERFREGPQRGMFEQDRSGLPRLRGGEIPGAFWNAGPGQAQDVESFRALVDENPYMLEMLRGLARTEAGATANAAGELPARAFNQWMDARMPALNALMDPGEVQVLQAIGEDLNRSAAAQSRGRVSGSDTMQKANAMMGNALLDNPIVGALAQRLPLGIGNAFTGPALAAMRDASRRMRAQELATILADPERAAQALEALMRSQYPLGEAGQNVLSLGLRAAPLALPATD